MKKYIIKEVKGLESAQELMRGNLIVQANGLDDMQVSDGYHTMDELYEHRIELYIALCRSIRENYEGVGAPDLVWRSKRHSDGELAFGTGTQFVLGINVNAGYQITYHIPIERWDEAGFAKTLEKAPEYDGHSSAEVLERLKKLS